MKPTGSSSVSSRGRSASGLGKKMYFVYILKSLKNGKSYVGFTSKEATTRLKEHNLGSNTWTRQNGPFELKYYESYIYKVDAIRREDFLKTGVGKKLKKLILNGY